jgi:hypothetical protein
MLSFLGAEGFMDDDVKTRLPRFFHNWARYSRRGPVLHVVTSVAQHLLAMVAMVGVIAIVLFALFGGVAFFVSFILASLLANALWIASSRHEHLLCVTVTLIVTVTSAILCASYMQGVGLWLVALTAGVLSGLLTEAVRRIVVFAFNNTILYKFLGDVIGDPDRPEELKFGVTKWRIWRWAENLFDTAGQKLVSIMAA